MALYQNTSVDTTKLILGNYKIETSVYASTAGTFTWINLGAGMVNKFGHNITKYDTQAGNAPDPVEGIADETFTIDMELMEFDLSVMSAMTGGAITGASSGTVFSVIGGGNTVVTPRALRLTNRRIVSGSTKETILIVYSATMDTGVQFTAKADEDPSPMNIMPVTITAKNDATRTAGSQLFSLTKTV